MRAFLGLGVILAGIQVHIVSGQGFGRPDYESEWLLLRAEDDTLSYIEVQHKLGQVPALVEVLVKSNSEPNKDFIFKGVGNGGRDDDDNSPYGSVLYTYNENSVRLFAPNSRNDSTGRDYAVGNVIHTGELPYWKGVNFQASIEATVKVRCWSRSQLPASCYEKLGLTMIAGSEKQEETYLELEHTLHQRPPIVNVRAMLLNGADEGWYIDAQGSNTVWYDTVMKNSKTGGLVYGYSNESIRIWASSMPAPGNVLLTREESWGHKPAHSIRYSSIGRVEIRAWCSFIGQIGKTVRIGPGISDEDLEIELPTKANVNNTYISVKVEPRDGANEGFLFDGTGGAIINTRRPGTPCSYGGVVYAYSDTTLRVWRPNHTEGAALCIGSEMGQGVNSQASNSVNLVITVWLFTDTHLREWSYQDGQRDACTRYIRLAEDARPANTSNLLATVTYPTSILSCHDVCADSTRCLAFAWDENGCHLYNSTDFQIYNPKNGSEVWGFI